MLKYSLMNVKIVSTPIGFFNSIYSSSGLQRLTFLGKKKSQHTKDKELQKLLDEFFSTNGLNIMPNIDLHGSHFQLKVWSALCDIPRGKTMSYSLVANQIGTPGAARAVGTACKLNPIPLFIPCHRVVKQDRSIGQFGLGIEHKRYLLELERV
jgi:O-6-methylguanine DNA methyltransferase